MALQNQFNYCLKIRKLKLRVTIQKLEPILYEMIKSQTSTLTACLRALLVGVSALLGSSADAPWRLASEVLLPLPLGAEGPLPAHEPPHEVTMFLGFFTCFVASSILSTVDVVGTDCSNSVGILLAPPPPIS